MICPKCKIPDSMFHKGAWQCKVCANATSRRNHARRMQNDPNYREAKRSAYIKTVHGITLDQYKDRLAQQNNRCAICKVKLLTSGHGTHLDHCHKTGKLRAFLCTNCNRGLGHFQDNPALLQDAADYLLTHREEQFNESSH